MSKRQNAGNLAVVGVPEAAGGDGKVLVTAADTTPGFLSDKLAAGISILLVTINPGANERVLISAGCGILDALETGVNTTWDTLKPDIVKNNTTNAWTLTLPILSGLAVNDRKKIVVFAGLTGIGGAVTIAANAADTIDGAATLIVAINQSRTIFPFAGEWNTI